jgi:hypothetical protein
VTWWRRGARALARIADALYLYAQPRGNGISAAFRPPGGGLGGASLAPKQKLTARLSSWAGYPHGAGRPLRAPA